jgi:hypothetical protein
LLWNGFFPSLYSGVVENFGRHLYLCSSVQKKDQLPNPKKKKETGEEEIDYP